MLENLQNYILFQKLISYKIQIYSIYNISPLKYLFKNFNLGMSILALCIFLTIYNNTMMVLFYVYSLYPLPQIIDNFSTKKRYQFNYWIFIFLGLPKLGYTVMRTKNDISFLALIYYVVINYTNDKIVI